MPALPLARLFALFTWLPASVLAFAMWAAVLAPFRTRRAILCTRHFAFVVAKQHTAAVGRTRLMDTSLLASTTCALKKHTGKI
jgi:hypothetical protein